MAKFKPGQSGNPGGRPKGDITLRQAARERTAEMLAAMIRLVRDPKTPPATCLAAAQAVLDRAWGKPIQPSTFVDADGNDRPIPLEQHGQFETARRIAHLLQQGIRALPAQQPALETANRESDLQRPSESLIDSESYPDSSDDPAEAI